MMNIHTSYLYNALNPAELSIRVRTCAAVLEKYQFDAIAATGVSGLVFASALSFVTGKPLLIVRKQQEVDTDVRKGGCHSGKIVEGDLDAKTYVFVDEMISSGTTYQRVTAELTKFNDSRCIGAYLYDSMRFNPEAPAQ